MICPQARDWIPQLLDEELDAERRTELERHLQSCVNCAEALHKATVLREKVRADAPYFPPPMGLEGRVRGALRKELTSQQWTAPAWWKAAAAIAAALVLTVFLFNRPRTHPEDQIANEVVSTHIRALLPGHLIDVPSSDRHTVKPWFAGKLDFSPRVEDLAAKGFALEGGRLDYLNGRTVAALVFARRRHVIDLFIAPRDAESERDNERVAIRGYNVIHWTDSGGMSYWAVSDLNADELAALETEYQKSQ